MEEMTNEVPIKSTWVPICQNITDWSQLYKATLNPKSKLNHHPIFNRQSNLSSDHDLIKNPNWIAIKTVDLGIKRYPHDIKREAKILSSLDHPNIVPLLATTHNPPTFSLYIPLYTISLTQLLQSSQPEFTPNLPAFYFLSKHIIHQLASGLTYLHQRGIAHRDVGPSNVVFDQFGTVIWIDFGTAWSLETSGEESGDNKLEFELGTMPYRAPELLFGSRNYSPLAIDQWSLGCLLAEFFTPLIPKSTSALQSRSTTNFNDQASFSYRIEDDHDESALDWYTRPMSRLPEEQNWSLPKITGVIEDETKERKTLFVGDLGDIGLVNSIFKLLGTPDHSTWPESKTLPDFLKLNFHKYLPEPIANHLPNLKPKDQKQIEEEANSINDLIDLISNLLIYQSDQRLTSIQVLSHIWLSDLKDNYDQKSYYEWMKIWLVPT